MAASTFETAAAVTRATVNKGFIGDSISTHTAFLWKLRSKGNIKLVSGGTAWKTSVLLYENNQVTPMTRYQVVPTVGQDVGRQASYDPKSYLCAVPIAQTDLLDNEDSAERIVSIIMAELKAARVAFENTIDQDLITGDGSTDTKRIDGLASAIVADPTAISPGGLSGSTYENWRCDYTTSFGNFAANYESKLLAAWIAVTVGNDHPDLHLTTPTIWTKYHNVLVPAMRYEDVKAANQGFDTLTYKGQPVIYDSNVPSGTWYMLNCNWIEWRIHRKAYFSMTPWDVGTAKGQWARVALMALYSNLFFTSMKRHAYLGGIT